MWKNSKNKNRLRKGVAIGLTAAMASGNMTVTAFAGPPSIDTDEALYVNLDYYGARTHTSIVKGCNLNGIRSFTDYGTYTDVTNMSSHVEPVQTEDGVTWNLPEDSKERFYYECQMDNESIILPWDFDISYQLNGVPVEAEALAGADGLVAIDVACTPNEKAKDYYKNNMLLQVATAVNMEDVNTIVAPGSQTQSLGTYKVILFAAVPGETATFHMEIGSSDFESMGIFMMMVPGTLDQMKEIKDIREAKDTFSDSAEELIDSLNDVLDKLDGLTNGVATTKEGLRQLQNAKEKFDASKDELTASTDQGIEELAGLSAALNELSPDIDNVHQTMLDISEEMDRLVDVARGSEDDFADLGGKLNGLKNDLRDLQGDLQNTGSVTQAKVDKLQAQVDGVQGKLDEMSEALGMVTSGSMTQAQMAQALGAMKQQTLALIKSLEPYIGKAQADSMRQELQDAIAAAAGGNVDELYELLDQYTQMIGQVQDVVYELQEVLDNSSVDGTFTSSAGVLNELDNVAADLENAMAGISTVNSIKKRDQADFDRMLDDTMVTAQRLTSASGNLANTLTILQNTLKANRADVESGTEKTLDGLIEIMERAVADSTTTRVKDANEKMKESVKSEIDKVEDETNFLNLDVEQQLISFTSDKNETPASIQIILKTQEISEDSVTDNAVDIEPVVESHGLWYRITQVFVKIWNGIKGIFQ